MGGKDAERIQELVLENRKLRENLSEYKSHLEQSEINKKQIQASYEEAIQALADSEAKREHSDKELKLAHEQISLMWSELGSLRSQLEGPCTSNHSKPVPAVVTDPPIELQCTLCREKINHSSRESTPPSYRPSPQSSPRPKRNSWLSFGRKSRVQDLETHSKLCSTGFQSRQPQQVLENSSQSKKTKSSPALARKSKPPRSPQKQAAASTLPNPSEDFLLVNVTRSPPGVTDHCPFKVITKTNMAHLPQQYLEVHRSQSDFQWLYEALQEACPERIVPPLKPPISLDATMSEFQRFLTRVCSHKALRKHHFFIVFLTGTAEELRSLRAKLRPHSQGEAVQYRPAVGRDTNSGPLVQTKDYLCTLEQNINGLVSHLETSTRRASPTGKIGHWFRAISESEPEGTYLSTAASDLSRTCESIESHQNDTEDGLLMQNLQSMAEYIVTAKGLLMRVEEAVDKFLYWDEEVTLLETGSSSPVVDSVPPLTSPPEQGNEQDIVFDDSGVSDVTTSSNNSNNSAHTRHMTSHDSGEDGVSTSEKWAQANKNCADAKDYLEMMCHGLADELSHFDLQKESELKQVLLDYASAQQEKHDKCQGKWYAMKLLLDTPINPDTRAIQFSNNGEQNSL